MTSTKNKFKPFMEFPTPNLLAKAQRDYAATNPKHEKEKDSSAPSPFPPPTKKSEIFDRKDYVKIDNRASEVSPCDG